MFVPKKWVGVSSENSIEIKGWLNNYIPYTTIDAIIHPCPQQQFGTIDASYTRGTSSEIFTKGIHPIASRWNDIWYDIWRTKSILFYFITATLNITLRYSGSGCSGTPVLSLQRKPVNKEIVAWSLNNVTRVTKTMYYWWHLVRNRSAGNGMVIRCEMVWVRTPGCYQTHLICTTSMVLNRQPPNSWNAASTVRVTVKTRIWKGAFETLKNLIHTRRHYCYNDLSEDRTWI